ncbi:MAG: TolC family protein, partial [Sinobacteraceae bacterium]|nr:TolC family protein [Nevskiaceae bacterium]
MNRPLACIFVSLALVSSAATAKDFVGVYEDALKSDPQIHQAEANRRASREARPQAWSALLPQVNGTLSRTQDRQDGTEPSQNIGTSSGTPGNPQGSIVPGSGGAPSAEFLVDSISKTWSLNLRESLFSW